jgi:hypothetical protein
LAIYFEEILSYIVPNIFCGYFISSKGPNWEVIWILPIFGVSFWLNIGYLTPRGWPYIVSLPTVWSFILKKYYHTLSQIYLRLLYIIKGSKLGIYLYISNIRGQFLVKFWVLDPPGWPYIVVPPAVWSFILKKYYHTLSQIYFVAIWYHQRAQIGQLLT